MINAKKEVVAELKTTGYPVYYELFLSSQETPCISYLEDTNFETISTKAAGVSSISFTVKAWGKDVAECSTVAAAIDKAMRNLGFERTGTSEMSDDTLICQILKYRVYGFENY